jgi:hypothetical protein
MPVGAKIRARRGELDRALALATDAVELAAGTDALNQHAKAQHDLGEVLSLADRGRDARAAYGLALELYSEKGNVVGASQVRSLLDDVALV